MHGFSQRGNTIEGFMRLGNDFKDIFLIGRVFSSKSRGSQSKILCRLSSSSLSSTSLSSSSLSSIFGRVPRSRSSSFGGRWIPGFALLRPPLRFGPLPVGRALHPPHARLRRNPSSSGVGAGGFSLKRGLLTHPAFAT